MNKKHTHKELQQVGLFILDKSGSMSAIKESTIVGFNEYLNKMQKNKVQVAFNLTLFDDDCTEERYTMTPISKVKPLNAESFIPCGMTPLYDSAVEQIEKLEERVSSLKGDVAVSVVIMTDGGENSSKSHDQECLRDLIKKLEAKGNWTFAYLGANQDSYAVAGGIGIMRGSTMDWASDPAGTKRAFSSLAMASVNNVNLMAASYDAGVPTASLNNNKGFFDNAKGGGGSNGSS